MCEYWESWPYTGIWKIWYQNIKNFPLSIRPFGVWERSLEQKWTFIKLTNNLWKNGDICDFCHFFCPKIIEASRFSWKLRPISDIDKDHFHILYHIDLTQIQESQSSPGTKTYFRLTIYTACKVNGDSHIFHGIFFVECIINNSR